ncbi:hypothetical protein STREPTOSP366_11480 [Streptomyces variabilis]
MRAPTPAYARTGTRSRVLRARSIPRSLALVRARYARTGAGGTTTVRGRPPRRDRDRRGPSARRHGSTPSRHTVPRASRGAPPRWVGVTAVPLRIAPRARHRGAAACAVADLLRPGGPADAARTACERAMDTRPGRSGAPRRRAALRKRLTDRRTAAPGRPTAHTPNPGHPQPRAPPTPGTPNTDRTTATPLTAHASPTGHTPSTTASRAPPGQQRASRVPARSTPPVGALARGRTTGRSSRRLPSGPARAWDSVRRQPRSTAPVRSVARATAASRAADASSTVSVRSSARKRSA